MTPKTIIIMGKSGAGKGTQARLINEYLKKQDQENPVFYVETGAHFREFIQREGYTSSLSKQAYARADRQPDFLAAWNWADIIINGFEENMHLVMDGTPRSLTEAHLLCTAFKFYKRTPIIIYISTSDDWVREKLAKRNRVDDASAFEIENKINWFNQDVVPALEYFKKHESDNYVEVNGEQTIEQVHQEVLKHVLG